MPETFDVFLSHNSRDKPTVERIGDCLKARGLRVWLDKWELRPGLPWQDEIEKGIDASSAVAVVIGEDGLGPWEAPEMRAFIDRSRHERLPVIPVLLPGAPEKPELPTFLKAFTWVDLRAGIDREGLDLLIWGVTGRRPEDATPEDVPGVRAPALHNLPFPPLGNLFKGRDPVLAELAADLSAQPATAIVQPHALHGLGGIGKTRLAVEYAWRSGDRYDAVFFVRADTPQELSRGLGLLARLRLPGLLKLDGADEETVVDAVLAWLRENRPWLLILDNVDSKDAAGAVRKLLPRLSEGHVLVTSRLSRWPAGIRRRSIEELSTEDAVLFLLERTAEDRRQAADDAELASRLAELLDGLPLALEQAGAYVAAHGIGFADYLAAWNDERSAVLEWHDEDEMSYPMPVAVTWQRTFAELDPTSQALLRLCAHLAPDPIPVEMLTAGESIVAEAAELVGIQERAVAKRYLRALERLKQLLSELPGGLTEVRL